MKVILHDYEPQRVVVAVPVPVAIIKPRRRFTPVVAETRLFHAL